MTIPLVISIISLSLCVAGFFFLRWYISRRTAASQLLEEYRDEVNRLIGGIHAATDKNLLLMEDKIKTLKKLMEDTDKRISVYMRELQRSRTSEAIYKNLGRGIREALETNPHEAASSETASPAETESPAGSEPRSPKETPLPKETQVPRETPSLKETPSPREAQAPAINELPFTDEEKGAQPGSAKKQKKRKTANAPSSKKPPEKPRIKMQIAEMAIQGLSPAEIAAKLGISIAEVDLALQLLNINREQ